MKTRDAGAPSTVTWQLALLPLKVLAVTVVVPRPRAVMVPSAATATMFPSYPPKRTWQPVFLGKVTPSLYWVPTPLAASKPRVPEAALRVIFFGAFTTVTWQSSCSPVEAVTPTVAVPFFLAVITPVALMGAIFALEVA